MSKQELVEKEAQIALQLEREISGKIAEYKALQDKLDGEWKRVESLMIENGVKQVKGDWGTLTIAERLNWSIDQEALPPRFWKKVPDTTKISTIFRLEGKTPKGASPSYTQYLTKRIKGDK